MADKEYERTLEETSTWTVAVVCFVLILISLFIEHLIHKIGSWLKKKHKGNLYEALEKVKAELMLLGFISLLLTVAQTPISSLCIPKSIASSMRPCSAAEIAKKELDKKEADKQKSTGKLLLELAESYIPRRSLATKGYNECPKGKVPFVSAYGIHQLHIFIFVLAVVHVIYCIVTYALGKTKMGKWEQWEEETKTIEYQYSNDPGRFRFARDTTFGRRHLNAWSKTSVTLWTVCFFRQFVGSVTKVDYLTLRHGFITAQFAPGSGSEKMPYDFCNYIQRSLEKDFKTVVEISPVIWFVTVLFLLTNLDGLHSYLWLPLIPLIVVLIVGTKLQVIITKLGLRIQEKGDVVRGAPLVKPGDDLFWFDKPSFMLFLIHLVLFTNAFQLAFFAWSSYEFGFSNCFHKEPQDIAIRIIVGLVVQILCSYVTLPLYALVIQMGTRMKPTVFNKRVSKMLNKWHHKAQKETQHGRRSESNTPTHDSSPIHLLHNSNNQSGESFPNLRPPSHSEHHDHRQFYDPESQQQAAESSTHESASIELPIIRPAANA
ncbi:MLO-like protein 2 isoform X3 [Brassica rapa]|uniref:MLO-like protein 2 isoform X3 n=1 Tax=Brassica campestris TaxID=3711 RepID=UPI00142D60EE|nr:MLO-like protein 2 isoform X3 [Brassica rapa]